MNMIGLYGVHCAVYTTKACWEIIWENLKTFDCLLYNLYQLKGF